MIAPQSDRIYLLRQQDTPTPWDLDIPGDIVIGFTNLLEEAERWAASTNSKWTRAYTGVFKMNQKILDKL